MLLLFLDMEEGSHLGTVGTLPIHRQSHKAGTASHPTAKPQADMEVRLHSLVLNKMVQLLKVLRPGRAAEDLVSLLFIMKATGL
jgi:hypothetical protein